MRKITKANILNGYLIPTVSDPKLSVREYARKKARQSAKNKTPMEITAGR